MLSSAPSIDPRAREVTGFTQEGALFALTLGCGHVVRRKIMIGSVPSRAICPQCPAAGGMTLAPSTPAPRRPRKSPGDFVRPGHWFDWSAENIAKLRLLWADQTITVDDIVAEMGARSKPTVARQAKILGLPKRSTGRRRLAGVAGSPRSDGHQRRFLGLIDRNNRDLGLSPKHRAAVEGRTRFRRRIRDSSAAKHVLVSGENNRKIGRVVKKGPWAGMPITMLTLEERKTCPRTCEQWLNCYGNNMNWALRIEEDGDFLIHLTSELLRLNAKHPKGFVVRLHVLGDFFSTEYVAFWKLALETMPALHVYGYTARPLDSDIGAALWAIVRGNWTRFAMRWSNRGSKFAASEVVADESEAKGVICPAELDEKRSCGTCGLCWASKRGAPAIPLISFLRH